MRSRTVWIVVIAAAVVVAAGLSWFFLARGSSAEDHAEAYFQALADGDLPAVRTAGVIVDEQAAAAFLAAAEHLSDVSVSPLSEETSSATVAVSYRLAAQEYDTELTLLRDGERWVPEPASALGAVTTNAPLAIGDAVLQHDTEITLLPAAYTAVAAPSAFLAGETTFAVLPGSSEDIEIDATLRPEASVLAQEELDDYAASCTVSSTVLPASCGIVIPWAADFTSVSEFSYRVEKLPQITISRTDFRAEGGELIATVTGTAPDGSNATRTYRTTTWSLRGDVSFTADDIALSVW
ncbi:hypothetical protein [Microbacterium sp. A94]|uniref:hypothetical protein n=1 Tax=Microbacterium sp. A94 TaxID=3450717 RepID=UPI003F41CFB9